MAEEKGKVNGYRCEGCGTTTYTINRDEGTTPFRISCPSGCGAARSMFYRVEPGVTPTHEWFRPTLAQARRQGPEQLEYVRLGGLALREIAKEG